MENDYRITKLHGTLIGDNRIPDLPVGEKTKVFSSTNGKTAWVDLPEGGKSVSPMLNLMDFSGELPIARTSITEEEKTNLEKGLYNSVIYADMSLGTAGLYSMYFPETAMFAGESLFFSKYNLSIDDATHSAAISSSSSYNLTIGEKGADGTYPITIEKILDASFRGGGGSSTPSTSIAFQDITVSELANHVGEFGNFHITDCKIAFLLVGLESEITGVWFSGNVRSENYLGGSLWVYVNGSPGYYIFYGSGSYAINSNGKIEGGRCTVGVFNQYGFGSLQTFGNDGTFNSAAGSRSLAEVPDNGNFAYVGKINQVGGGSQQAIAFTSSVTLDATGDQTYCKLSGIFTNGIGEMTFVKDTDGKPKSQKFATWLPPVSANSEGKSLIVTNGNAQWTTTPRYEHTITIKNSAGKILWTQTMRNSSNTVVNSYTNLKTLFGEATYAGFGEYCQLNLEGGTEATDKLIKADGTEVTLASLGAIVYTDKCFLPK